MSHPPSNLLHAPQAPARSLSAAQRRPWTVGELLHGYRIRGVLGDGAFSRVFLVEDPGTRTAYALKHVLSEGGKEDRWVDQVRAEWQIGRGLDHPALRRVVGCRHAGWFLRSSRDVALVLEPVHATSLADQARPSIPECLWIFRDVASALLHMHERGFVHADMKPLNILYTPDHRTKVIDLGQAVRIGTAKDRIQGTPGYMAPEQLRREALTEQTDVFNFAATMHSILLGLQQNGLHLFAPQAASVAAGDPSTKVDAGRLGPSEPLHLLDPSIPEQLSLVILDCLDPNPVKRKNMAWIEKVLQGLC